MARRGATAPRGARSGGKGHVAWPLQMHSVPSSGSGLTISGRCESRVSGTVAAVCVWLCRWRCAGGTRPGRQGPSPPSSWATAGPPPRGRRGSPGVCRLRQKRGGVSSSFLSVCLCVYVTSGSNGRLWPEWGVQFSHSLMELRRRILRGVRRKILKVKRARERYKEKVTLVDVKR